MSASEYESSLQRFEDRVVERATAPYVLTLFVTGASDMSMRAIGNVRAICENHLAGRYHLEVVDVHRDAALMSSYDVVAAPTLIKEAPLPKRMLVGDLSDTVRVLAALDIGTGQTSQAVAPKRPDR
jgi:circadian clock protein KaiB